MNIAVPPLEKPDPLPAATRAVQVEPTTRRKPKTVPRLLDWQYLERSLQRLLCAWGRCLPEWQDKVAIHRHQWETAGCVRRLRERLAEFPGATSNLEAPVSRQLEQLVNTVLDAPTVEDAIDGVYQLLLSPLVISYGQYAQSAHPVHDAPTLSTLHEISAIKESQRLWLRDYRRRHPHRTDAAYRAAVERELAVCGHFQAALSVEAGTAAQPCGVATGFRVPLHPARPAAWRPTRDFMPFVRADFTASLEARRLFWCYGYMLELSLAEEMLRWLWDGHYMPWDWQHAVSRHLWDESRHGDSGLSRFLDFGITVEEIGFPSAAESFDFDLARKAQPLTPAELYQEAFFTGMIAETGHFSVKHEAYDDFKQGGDLESAEMMLFDIIDEGAHVQYFHQWVEELARRSGTDAAGYRERANRERREKQENELAATERLQTLRRDPADPNYAFYLDLLARMRASSPLSNAQTCPPRSPKPM